MLIYFSNILTVIICHITHNHFVEESFLISKSVTLLILVSNQAFISYTALLPYLPRQAPILIPLKDLLRSSPVFVWLSNMATLSSGRMDVLTRNYIFPYWQSSFLSTNFPNGKEISLLSPIMIFSYPPLFYSV